MRLHAGAWAAHGQLGAACRGGAPLPAHHAPVAQRGEVQVGLIRPPHAFYVSKPCDGAARLTCHAVPYPKAA